MRIVRLLLVAWWLGALMLSFVAVGLAAFGADTRGRRWGVLGGRLLFALIWPVAMYLDDGRRALLSMFERPPADPPKD